MFHRFSLILSAFLTVSALSLRAEPLDIPSGTVTFQLQDGFAEHTKWLHKIEGKGWHWTGTHFYIHRLPNNYDDWGIRDDWHDTVKLTMTAKVELPLGETKLLVRARGLSRVTIDGKVVATTRPHSGKGDGHNPVEPLPEPPMPGLRRAAYKVQEVIVPITINKTGTHTVILETLVGSKTYRAEPSETLIAIQEGQSFNILTPTDEPAPLTDNAVSALQSRVENELVTLDDEHRRSLAASQNSYWQSRHDQSRQAHEPLPADAIDTLLSVKVERLRKQSQGNGEGKTFHEQVLPVLRDNCFRCHDEKDRGGLRLSSLKLIQEGGDSGETVIVPNHPEKSSLIQRLHSDDEAERMPPNKPLSKSDQKLLEDWIANGAQWPEPSASAETFAFAPIVDDPAFARRAYLDSVGVPPSEEELTTFLKDERSDKRAQLIDKLLEDDRYADHWVSYWQDALAENPNILKPSLNNTGPFRLFLYDALRDNQPFDRMVTELIMMRGSTYNGGSAGFGMAAQNDSPYAAKAHVLASAFLGINMQCARCHDSPYHSTTQQDLFSIAAMLNRKPLTVPKTSSVSAGFFEKKGRESLIKVTLKPGTPVKPIWPFPEMLDASANAESLLHNPKDSRERLALIITSPTNDRFAQVLVNRVWQRLIGTGFVEPAHDWEGHSPSHPELLKALADDFVASNYDLKHLIQQIMTAKIYQRQAVGHNLDADAETRTFTAPDRRRMTAEQVVDSLFATSGTPMRTEVMSFDPDALRPAKTMINLGQPSRAWMLAELSNERDRPSLALPRAQAVTDVLQAFGWNGSRQNPIVQRETDPNLLQPGILANSTLTRWVTTASTDSALSNIAVNAVSVEALVDSLYLRFLGRLPTTPERAETMAILQDGFDERVLAEEEQTPTTPLEPLPYISWSNHLVKESTVVKMEMERRARAGDPADPRLETNWREAYEDVVWSLVNSPEFVWIP